MISMVLRNFNAICGSSLYMHWHKTHGINELQNILVPLNGSFSTLVCCPQNLVMLWNCNNFKNSRDDIRNFLGILYKDIHPSYSSFAILSPKLLQMNGKRVQRKHVVYLGMAPYPSRSKDSVVHSHTYTDLSRAQHASGNSPWQKRRKERLSKWCTVL